MKPIGIHYLTRTLPAVQEAGKSCGYSVALREVGRNLDLIAVPWTENAKSGTELVDAVCQAVSGHSLPPGRRLHGRVCWPIHLGCGSFLELSVLPRDPGCEGDEEELATAGQWAPSGNGE